MAELDDDILPDDVVLTIVKVAEQKKASLLAKTIFSVENIMAYIKNMLLDAETTFHSATSFQDDIEGGPTERGNKLSDQKQDSFTPTTSEFQDCNNENTIYVVQPVYPVEDDVPPGVLHIDDEREEEQRAGTPTEEQNGISTMRWPISNSLSGKLSEMRKREIVTPSPPDEKRPRKPTPKRAELKRSRPVYICTSCGYQTDRMYRFKKHTATHTDEVPFKCSSCEFTTPDQALLIEHKKSHSNVPNTTLVLTPPKPIKPSCSNPLKSHPSNLKTANSDKPMLKCDQCSYQTARKSHLHRHKLSHSGVKPFSCQPCGFSCTDKWQLNKHNKTRTHIQNHGSVAKLYECDRCTYSTPRKDHHRHHMMSHNGDKPYKCPIPGCGYSSIDNWHLKRHLKSTAHRLLKHLEGNILMSCSKCNYTTNMVEELKRHHLSAHPDSPSPILANVSPVKNNEADGDSSHKNDAAPGDLTGDGVDAYRPSLDGSVGDGVSTSDMKSIDNDGVGDSLSELGQRKLGAAELKNDDDLLEQLDRALSAETVI